MAISDLEERLLDLGRQLAHPATPELAMAVSARLEAKSGRRRWRLALAAAAALLIAAVGTVVASPEARQAVAGYLGLPGFEIRKVKSLPTPKPPPYRRQVTLEEARTLAGFRLLTPSGVETVRTVWFDGGPPGGEVELDLGGGAIVTEVKGAVDGRLFGKLVPPGGEVRPVTVGGHPGYWFSGDLHAFFYSDADGGFRSENLRIAGATLVWVQSGILIRIEGAASENDAQRIAALLR